MIPGSGRSTGERNGFPLYRILAWRSPTDRGAWSAAAHRVTKNQTRPNAFHFFRASGFPVCLCVFLMQMQIHNKGERHPLSRGQGHLQLHRPRLAMCCMVPRAKIPVTCSSATFKPIDHLRLHKGSGALQHAGS